MCRKVNQHCRQTNQTLTKKRLSDSKMRATKIPACSDGHPRSRRAPKVSGRSRRHAGLQLWPKSSGVYVSGCDEIEFLARGHMTNPRRTTGKHEAKMLQINACLSIPQSLLECQKVFRPMNISRNHPSTRATAADASWSFVSDAVPLHHNQLTCC